MRAVETRDTMLGSSTVGTQYAVQRRVTKTCVLADMLSGDEDAEEAAARFEGSWRPQVVNIDAIACLDLADGRLWQGW